MGGNDPVSKAAREVGNGVSGVGKAVSGVGKAVESGVQQVGKAAEYGVQQVGKTIESGVQQLGKNIEKNVGGVLTETAYALGTGDFNNFDQTLLKLGSMAATGGLSAGLNPQSMQYKETNIQRATREAQEQAALKEVESNLAKERERLAGLANLLTASASARRLAPGMSQTLLGSAPSTALITTKA